MHIIHQLSIVCKKNIKSWNFICVVVVLGTKDGEHEVTEADYNIYDGFMLDATNTVKSNYYVCRAYNSTRQYVTGDIDYASGHAPVIRSTPRSKLQKGERQLICTFDVSNGPISNLNVTWLAPNSSTAFKVIGGHQHPNNLNESE